MIHAETCYTYLCSVCVYTILSFILKLICNWIIPNFILFEEYQELEALADPMRKEVALVRKRIDSVNKELKPLGHTCQKKVKFIEFLRKPLILGWITCYKVPNYTDRDMLLGTPLRLGFWLCISGERIQRRPWSF